MTDDDARFCFSPEEIDTDHRIGSIVALWRQLGVLDEPEDVQRAAVERWLSKQTSLHPALASSLELRGFRLPIDA